MWSPYDELTLVCIAFEMEKYSFLIRQSDKTIAQHVKLAIFLLAFTKSKCEVH